MKFIAFTDGNAPDEIIMRIDRITQARRRDLNIFITADFGTIRKQSYIDEDEMNKTWERLRAAMLALPAD